MEGVVCYVVVVAVFMFMLLFVGCFLLLLVCLFVCVVVVVFGGIGQRASKQPDCIVAIFDESLTPRFREGFLSFIYFSPCVFPFLIS